jgi:hypothetical protein
MDQADDPHARRTFALVILCEALVIAGLWAFELVFS